MAKVIIHVTMSLDGFIAGPNDGMDWVFGYGDDKIGYEVMKETGAVVMGKRTFEIPVGANESKLPYGGMIKVPLIK